MSREGREERLKKGYNFFMELKPSRLDMKHLFWLKEWLVLLKEEQKELSVENLSDEQIGSIFK